MDAFLAGAAANAQAVGRQPMNAHHIRTYERSIQLSERMGELLQTGCDARLLPVYTVIAQHNAIE
jgi:hypothetical protein